MQKLVLGKILQQLAQEKKLGHNLKGLSPLLLKYIEGQIWELINIEVKIFQQEQEINKYQDILC